MNVRFAIRLAVSLGSIAVIGTSGLTAAASAVTMTPAAGTPALRQSVSPGTVGVPVGGTVRVVASVRNTGTAAATSVALNIAPMGTPGSMATVVGFSNPPAVSWNGHFWTWHVGTLQPGQGASLGVVIRSNGPIRTDFGYAASGNGPSGTVGYLCDNPACTDYLHVLSPIPTAANIAVTRQGAAVYVNALARQYTTAWSASPARTVYVQRLVRGAWQTILQRTTNSIGRVSVGFIQPSAYTYRVYVAPTSSATSALSGGAVG